MKIQQVITLSAMALIALGILSSCNPAPGDNSDTADTVKITILQTADIHGQLDPHPELFWENDSIVVRERGGLANIKTLFDQERKLNPGRTFIVDGGDLIQGSGYAFFSKGDIFPEIIRKMGYDLLIPGNWEVVYGKESMMEVLNAYDTPVIAQNMFHEEDKSPLFPAYHMAEIEGVRLGFIGINDPDVPVRQNPIFSEGMEFSGIDEEVEKLIREVKHDKGADALFLLTHIGIFKQVELANNEISKDVDYILGNDTHERVRQPIQGKYAKVTEPGAFGSFVGKLVLHFVDGKIVKEEYELLDVDPEVYPADPEIQAMVDRAKEPYKEKLEAVIGHTRTPLFRYLTVENPMDNMITDAARWKTGADIAISNGFRFGNPIMPEGGKPAPITRANLWNLIPMDERVKMGKATGKQIKDWLEQEMHNAFAEDATERFGGWLVRFSGMEVDFTSKNPKGERINSITVKGQPMEDEKYYTISACERPGDPEHVLCRLPNAVDIEYKDYTIHQVVEEYLRKNSPVAPVIDGRAYSEDLGVYSFSTVPGTNYKFR
jgi:S-sulfosulfanyl-L-cysteine sulfohydrolase